MLTDQAAAQPATAISTDRAVISSERL